MSRIYTIKVKSEDLNTLLIEYNGMKSPDYFFTAMVDDIFILADKDGTVKYHGSNPFKLISRLKIDFEEIDNLELSLANNLFSAIGSDEVGTGDFFGPVVVCSCYVDVKDMDFLNSLGIMDSKKLTDKKILELGKILTDKLHYSCLILDNKTYNRAVSNGNNLNRIKAVLHNKAISNMINRLGEKIVILDQFCEPKNYFSYLYDVNNYQKINFMTKAESFHISVACASVIARYNFILEMDKLSNMVGFSLMKGASNLVDEQIAKIIKEKGPLYLNNIGKLNFKNYKKQEV